MMVNGHMCVGITGDNLMVRAGPHAYQQLLQRPHARAMDFAGKPLTGFVYVDAEGIAEDENLAWWVQQALDYIFTLPPKTK